MLRRTPALIVCLGLFAIESPESTRFEPQLPAHYQPPIVDLTTSTGSLTPAGAQQVQTMTVVGPGRRSFHARPACIASDGTEAGATCVNVCVHIPPRSVVTHVEGIAAREDAEWAPCNAASCVGERPELAKAMFGPAGYAKDQTFGMDCICWVFRNWHTTKARTVWLFVTYRPPPYDQWRDAYEAYPWRVLQSKVEQLTGPNPVDCGQHPDTRSVAQALSGAKQDALALKESLGCALRSSQQRIPFWTTKQTPTIDTFGMRGILGQPDGSMHIFNRCSGRRCPSGLSTRQCLVPAVEMTPGGHAQFGCEKWANDR